MKNAELIKLKLERLILIDITLFIIMYFVPTLSHITSLPFYFFEPMRIMLFISILYLPIRSNAYFLALSLPIFSFFVSGHPTIPKNVLISIELITNVFIFILLQTKLQNWKIKYKMFTLIFISIFVSKVVYYGLKSLLISLGVLKMEIISTGIGSQFLLMSIISLLFSIGLKKKRLFSQ